MDYNSSEILSKIAKYLINWKELSGDDIKIIRLNSCSNIIFKVEIKCPEKYPNCIPNMLIYREFGEQTDFIEYDSEKIIFQELGRCGIGPKTYGFSDKIRLEEYIIAKLPENKDMIQENFIKAIAEPFSRLHRIEIPLKNKQPMMKNLLNEENNTLLNKIRNILKVESEHDFKAKFEKLKEFFDDKEIKFLLDLLPISHKAVSLCHNDLNPTNILYNVSKTDDFEFKFIDCEYGGYNYRGFDIATYFMEIAFDYSGFPQILYKPELFADDKIIREFCRYYVFFQVNDELQLKIEKNEILNEKTKLEKLMEGKYTEEKFNNDVNELMQEIKIGMLLSYFFTSLWGVFQFKYSKIHFDFLQIALDKYELYKIYKKQYFI